MFAILDPIAALLERTGHAAEAVEFLAALSKAQPWNADARERLAAAQGNAAPLAGIAQSKDSSYAVRVEAARTLRRLKGPALSGVDSELDLLSSQTPLAGAQIASPLAYAARMDIAGATTDAAARERILIAAVSIDPQPVATKVALFKTEVAARRDGWTDAVGRQLLPPYYRDQTEFNPYTVEGFLAVLPLADRVAVARGLGDANQRLGNPRGAALFYEIAQKLAPADATARALAAQKAQLDLAARNGARRPVFSDNLDQDRFVHARLTR
jgi:hypothetical protein